MTDNRKPIFIYARRTAKSLTVFASPDAVPGNVTGQVREFRSKDRAEMTAAQFAINSIMAAVKTENQDWQRASWTLEAALPKLRSYMPVYGYEPIFLPAQGPKGAHRIMLKPVAKI